MKEAPEALLAGLTCRGAARGRRGSKAAKDAFREKGDRNPPKPKVDLSQRRASQKGLGRRELLEWSPLGNVEQARSLFSDCSNVWVLYGLGRRTSIS